MSRGAASPPQPAKPRAPRRDRVGREVYLTLEVLGVRLTAEFDRLCHASGLSAAQYSVLWVLCLGEDAAGVVQGSISEGLTTEASDVSRIVTRLEEAGLVTRKRSNDDRRVIRVKATRKGRNAFAKITEKATALHREQFSDLTAQELDQLLALLNRVLADQTIA